MKHLIILFFFFVLSLQSYSQNSSVVNFIKKTYLELTSASDFIFISDSTLVKSLKYEDLNNLVEDFDTIILRQLFDSGSLTVLTTNILKGILPNERFINESDFRKVTYPNLTLTEKEQNVLKTLDSLELHRNIYTYQRKGHERFKVTEDSLHATAEYQSFLEKRQKIDKRLLYFYPVVTYKTYSLVAIACYQSVTNNYGIVRIIKSK